MTAYYNDNDPRTAVWLRELISVGLITAGEVDERSIADVQPSDLKRFDRVHLFAGIGGWDYALQLAGWSGPVWTGSCPCQPFSVAGKRAGTADKRHLWPEMFRLIRECRPAIVFGEQVEGAVRLGWFDGVFADLEGAGYACAAAVLGAHSVGAPHIRQRLYWLANTECAKRGNPREPGCSDATETSEARNQLRRCGTDGRMGNSQGRGTLSTKQCRQWRIAQQNGGLGNAGGQGLPGWPGEPRYDGQECPPAERAGCDAWSDSIPILCRDGKQRRIPLEPALFPLSDGFSGSRVGLLRGAGNAIVPQVAAEFVKAYMGNGIEGL